MTYDRRRVAVGPWRGGVNEKSDPRYIGDDFLVVCNNFDILDDGSLRARPGLKEVYTKAGTIGYKVLGELRIFGNPSAMVMKYDTATGFVVNFQTFTDPASGPGFTSSWNYVNDSGGGSYANISRDYYKILQYNGYVYFLSGTTGKTFRRALSSISSAGGTNTVYTAWPASSDSLIFKDRVFAVFPNSSTINFSKATDPTDFTIGGGGGFVNVNPDDGDQIRRIVAINDSLYIFKTSSTWVLQYTSSPDDGIVRLISDESGAYDLVVHDNNIYLINKNGAYLFVNNSFSPISKLLSDYTNQYFNKISIFGRRLIANDWVMNLNTGAWSKWYGTWDVIDFDSGVFLSNITPALIFSGGGGRLYYAYDDPINGTPLDKVDGSYYYPLYDASTKRMTFSTEDAWKRLYWWSVDADLPTLANSGMVFYGASVNYHDSNPAQTGEAQYPLDVAKNKIIAKSTRFQEISFEFSMRKDTGGVLDTDPTQIPVGVDLTPPVDGSLLYPVIRKMNLYIGERTRVSQ